MKKREAVILAMMCAAALGNFGNIESAEASAENGTGKVLEIEKTQEPLRICVEEENADVLCQVITAWQKMYDGGQAELLVIPSGEEASEQKVQEIRKTIASGGGPDLFLTEVRIRHGASRKQFFFLSRKRRWSREPFFHWSRIWNILIQGCWKNAF